MQYGYSVYLTLSQSAYMSEGVSRLAFLEPLIGNIFSLPDF
jgi:hypothetical protein